MIVHEAPSLIMSLLVSLEHGVAWKTKQNKTKETQLILIPYSYVQPGTIMVADRGSDCCV